MTTGSKAASTGKRHLIIPDVQHKPGCTTDHLSWAGQYAVDMLPDTIVIIGDWWDMESLSSYDKGQKSFEGILVGVEGDCVVMNSNGQSFVIPFEYIRLANLVLTDKLLRAGSNS